ncbi:hypothetical protein AMQ84_04475 [Paenibacillus riograndensis]|uniref:Uncharacterized protein n=1 Tax=Paenibacillus riograndensis TaxID=483937 RepID=A0A132U9N5_9BACL|nr:hypothetical protein [Paenibacillus riograndensis]KWX80241.1 hypothetical protein AMQ84_04475 [Paenibacillus riograndensis]
MKKKRALSLANLVFLIPVILLSFFMWNDYKRYIENIDDYLPSLERTYMLDGGKKLIGFSNDDRFGEQYDVYLFDTGTETIIKKTAIRTNFQSGLGPAAYQQDGIIIPTYDDTLGLQLNYFHSTGGVEELAQGTMHIPSAWSSSIYSWRGRLIVAGESPGSEWYVAQVKDGKLDKVNLGEKGLLPARPVRVDEVHGSFKNDQAVPMFSVSLKDDRTALVSGILDKKGDLSVLLEKKDEGTFAAQDRAGAHFAKVFGFNNAKLVRENGNYPEEASFYNANEKQWGTAVPTPKPVYQARIFLLNDEELLIAGSTAEDELNGTVIGYVFNEKSGKFQDATVLLEQLPYENLENSETEFHKQLGSDILYYRGGDLAAGYVDMEIQKAKVFSKDQVEGWMVTEDETKVSLQSFWNYAKQGGAIIINWAVWVFIGLFSFLGLAIAPRMLVRSRMKKMRAGQHIQARIIDMQESGLYVNEQPQVRFIVQFEDEGQRKEVEIKQVISYLNPIQIGDTVTISYNRKKHKAVFITEEDLKHAAQESKPVLIDAVLTRIEHYGKVNRGQALQLHFTAEGRDYPVPVVQPFGFEYRTGERANLILIQGMVRIFRYGNEGTVKTSDQLSLQGEIIHMQKMPIIIEHKQLMLLEVMISRGADRIRKANSLFVPENLSVNVGTVIPVSMEIDDLQKETRLLQGKQGAAKVLSVHFEGTKGERPLANITAEKDGVIYQIKQTIEPVYGVEVGDELWIAYDEGTREAMIINYSSR